MLACDIKNAHLMADYKEWVWVAARTKFGSEAGKNMMEYFKIRDNKIGPPDVYL